MPIYEFRCEACGAGFEALVGSEDARAACPECGDPGPVRLYSPPAAPQRLVASPGDARAQERRNASLREATRSRFKADRERARRRPKGGEGGR